jgi:hypothetical protein
VASAAALAITTTMAPATAINSTGTGTPTTAATQVQAGSQANAAGELTSRVDGSYGRNGTVRGTFDPRHFIYRGGDVYAVGTLHAVARNGSGEVVGRDSKQIQIPVKNARTVEEARAATCQILHLVLGPLDLNLLGLKIHLDRVVLDITAESGPGNLLGNLLCAVAGLLDGRPRLIDLLRLANVLNRILVILGL